MYFNTLTQTLRMKQVIVTISFFIFISLSAPAQEPADKFALQKEREQLKKEIAETEKALNETRKTAKVNMGQLSLINRKMDLQGNIIDNINGEIRNLNN